MGHTGTTSAFIALLIQHAVSVALPVADLERSSDSEPRNIYETTRTSGNSDAAGAAGDSGGSINLKKRDQIAIIVVASVVVVIGSELPPRAARKYHRYILISLCSYIRRSILSSKETAMAS